VNISSVTSPKLIKEIALSTPYGLAVKDTALYVARGFNGWTLFGLSNPSSPSIIRQWTKPAVRDFIWIRDRLYTMCFDRVIIYSVSDPGNPVLVGEIE